MIRNHALDLSSFDERIQRVLLGDNFNDLELDRLRAGVDAGWGSDCSVARVESLEEVPKPTNADGSQF